MKKTGFSCEQGEFLLLNELGFSASALASFNGAVFLHSIVGCSGWMGAFKLVYASLTEYVLLFGTAMPTSGHSGRYWGDITDTLISGEFTQWLEGETAPHIHKPGATVPHPAWTASGVHWVGGTWMLEHMHGLIPTALPFAFSDGIFSSQDFYSLAKSTWIYAKHVTRSLMAGRI